MNASQKTETKLATQVRPQVRKTVSKSFAIVEGPIPQEAFDVKSDGQIPVGWKKYAEGVGEITFEPETYKAQIKIRQKGSGRDAKQSSEPSLHSPDSHVSDQSRSQLGLVDVQLPSSQHSVSGSKLCSHGCQNSSTSVQ